jgi:protein required for attachment to host cells
VKEEDGKGQRNKRRTSSSSSSKQQQQQERHQDQQCQQAERGSEGGKAREEGVIQCTIAVIQPWVLLVCGRVRRRTREGLRTALVLMGKLGEEKVVER